VAIWSTAIQVVKQLMVKRVRPTIEQIKDALVWWKSLKPIPNGPAPEHEVNRVREALNLAPRSNLGADDITHYWLEHIQPFQAPKASQQSTAKDEHDDTDSDS
jgi:hypothetical protein